MPETMTNVEIEDVLSSIRRLVTMGERAQARRDALTTPPVAEKLVLSPAFRIGSTAAQGAPSDADAVPQRVAAPFVRAAEPARGEVLSFAATAAPVAEPAPDDVLMINFEDDTGHGVVDMPQAAPDDADAADAPMPLQKPMDREPALSDLEATIAALEATIAAPRDIWQPQPEAVARAARMFGAAPDVALALPPQAQNEPSADEADRATIRRVPAVVASDRQQAQPALPDTAGIPAVLTPQPAFAEVDDATLGMPPDEAAASTAQDRGLADQPAARSEDLIDAEWQSLAQLQPVLPEAFANPANTAAPWAEPAAAAILAVAVAGQAEPRVQSGESTPAAADRTGDAGFEPAADPAVTRGAGIEPAGDPAATRGADIEPVADPATPTGAEQATRAAVAEAPEGPALVAAPHDAALQDHPTTGADVQYADSADSFDAAGNAGFTDAPFADVGMPDAASREDGVENAGIGERNGRDGSVLDAGAEDADFQDSGVLDAGVHDSGVPLDRVQETVVQPAALPDPRIGHADMSAFTETAQAVAPADAAPVDTTAFAVTEATDDAARVTAAADHGSVGFPVDGSADDAFAPAVDDGLANDAEIAGTVRAAERSELYGHTDAVGAARSAEESDETDGPASDSDANAGNIALTYHPEDPNAAIAVRTPDDPAASGLHNPAGAAPRRLHFGAPAADVAAATLRDGPDTPADATNGQASPATNVFEHDDEVIDEDALRDMITELIRQELQGALGERITRNVRKLVRAEINRALAGHALD